MRSIKRLSVWMLFVALLFLVAHNTAHAALCTSTASGNWNDSSKWDCGVVPGSLTNDAVVIATGHTITVDINTNAVYNVVINAGGALQFDSGKTLKISSVSGTPGVSNNGTFTGTGGTVEFNTDYGNATGTVSGTLSFENVTIGRTSGVSNIGVDFGTGSTINGTLSLNLGGFVSTNAPTYATGSTLKYNTGGVYGAGTEWATGSSGAGVPYHVQTSTSSTSVNFGASTSSRTARGNVTIDSGTFLALSTASGGDLVIGGSLANNGNSGTAFTANGRLVTFNGTGTQTITSSNNTTTNFALLKVDMGTANTNVLDVQSVITMSSGGLTLSNGTFKLSSASTITPFSSAPTIGSTAGLWVNGGTISAGSFGYTVDGLLRVSSGTLNVGTSNTNNINFSTGSTLTFDGGTTNVSAKLVGSTTTQTTTFSMSGSAVLNLTTVGSSATTLYPFDLQATGSSFTMSGGTVIIRNEGGTGAQDLGYRNLATTSSVTGGTLQIGDASTLANQTMQINSTAPIFNLAVNAVNSPVAKLQTNALTVKGNITLSGGTLDTNNLNISVAGNITNSGAFTAGTGTVTFNGSGTQNLTANNSTAFNNLMVNSGVVLVETVSADNATVSGTFTNNGTIRKSQSVSGTGTKTFGLAGRYNSANLSINVTTQGTLSNLQVDRIDSNHPNATTAQQTGRYWSITPTNGGYTANLTLPRSNSGAPSVCKHVSGTTWSCATNSSNSNDVTRNGITSFSDWAVGNDAPTSAGLVSFKAKLTPKNKVKVKWETGNELSVLGFNLHRQTVGNKKWVKVNGDIPIDAQNIGNPEGALYKLIDKQVKSGKAYRYKLEVLMTSGPSEWSEVVQVTIP